MYNGMLFRCYSATVQVQRNVIPLLFCHLYKYNGMLFRCYSATCTSTTECYSVAILQKSIDVFLNLKLLVS
jgi:chemotaxis methyl-accepting protein methylase